MSVKWWHDERAQAVRARRSWFWESFGASAVTSTFFIVSQTDELAEDRLRLSSEKAPPPEPFGPRYSRWVRTVFGSGFDRLWPVAHRAGQRHPGRSSPRDGRLSAFVSWTVGLGPRPGAGDLARHALARFCGRPPGAASIRSHRPSRRWSWSSFSISFSCRSTRAPVACFGVVVGILSLTVLLLPSTTALWLNGIGGSSIANMCAWRGPAAFRRSRSGGVTSCRT